jgi:mannose-6-phosphate isomerase-like protein (cupin superfamily)
MNPDKIRIETFDGEGLKRAIESDSWFVGIKNWKPANDAAQFYMIERHLQTEEVFVLLAGGCTLLIDHSDANDHSDVRCIPMERNKVYCVPRGVWHNTITTRDAKLILMENRTTSNENSEMYTLNAAELAILRKNLA